MITIIEGKPGSGKTYFSIYHILKKFYIYDNRLHEYFKREPVVVVSNIDNLRLDSVDLSEAVRSRGNKVFSPEYIDELRQIHGVRYVVFLIDEAQRFFDRKFYDKEVFFFFQYHRHYSVDIYLITQDVGSLAKELRELAEFNIRAVQRSLALSDFRYKRFCGSEVAGSINLPKDKNIFRLYKSFEFTEYDRPRPVYYKYLAIFGSLAVLVVLLFKFVFLDSFFSNPSPAKADAFQVSKPSAVASTVPSVPIQRSEVVYNAPSFSISSQPALNVDAPNKNHEGIKVYEKGDITCYEIIGKSEDEPPPTPTPSPLAKE